MPLEFRCSGCGQLLRVPETSVGKNARCPKCQNLMLVPASALAPAGAGPAAPGPIDERITAPTGNPFGEAALPTPPKPLALSPPSTDSLNPYASPATTHSYDLGYGSGASASKRPGLPWDVKRQEIAVWWETTRLVVTTPSRAFSDMRLEGGLGQPMMFALWGLAIGFVAQMVWQLPLSALPLMMGEPVNQEQVLAQLVGNLVGGVIGVVLSATIVLLVHAAITHAMLMLLGGTRQSFEATVRTLGYAQGSIAWIHIVPFVGPLIGFVWSIILSITGLARAHEISTGKAALAVLIPIAVCIVGLAALVAALVGIGFALSQ